MSKVIADLQAFLADQTGGHKSPSSMAACSGFALADVIAAKCRCSRRWRSAKLAIRQPSIACCGIVAHNFFAVFTGTGSDSVAFHAPEQ